MGDLDPVNTVNATDTVGLVSEGLLEAFFVMLPVVLSAIAASIIVGSLANRLGARDPQLAAIARAAAVVISLVLIGGTIARTIVDFSGDLWLRNLAGAGGG